MLKVLFDWFGENLESGGKIGLVQLIDAKADEVLEDDLEDEEDEGVEEGGIEEDDDVNVDCDNEWVEEEEDEGEEEEEFWYAEPAAATAKAAIMSG